jgi:hypothetical protein
MAGTKLPHTEVQKRVDACYNHRYNENKSQLQWLDYCHKTYGDKSEKQYCAYWNSAREQYDLNWKERLNKQLDPAITALQGLLHSDQEKIRQRAIDQVLKYTGNEINKVAIEGSMNVKLTWGDEQAEATDI